MPSEQPNNPLHGITLKTIVEDLGDKGFKGSPHGEVGLGRDRS